jgi:toxin ParE1/3/4
MTSPIIRRPRARQDIVQNALYLANENPDVARRFLDAVEETVAMIAAMPEMGAPRTYRHTALKDLRSIPVHGFDKHLVFYRPLDPGIEIVRVLHGARDLAAILEDLS